MKAGDPFRVILAQDPRSTYRAWAKRFTTRRGRELEELDPATAPKGSVVWARIEFHADQMRPVVVGRDTILPPE